MQGDRSRESPGKSSGRSGSSIEALFAQWQIFLVVDTAPTTLYDISFVRCLHGGLRAAYAPQTVRAAFEKITYPGINNKSEFTYGPTGERVKIVETVSGSVTSTKQFVGGEERDGSGSVTKQFFARGQKNGATKYFYGRDHLGSIRGMTDNSGASVSDRAFDPYGRMTVLSESVAPDFGFAGMYAHTRSGLNLTVFRAHSANLGCWLSRDPIGEEAYLYGANAPTRFVDPLGLYAAQVRVNGNEVNITLPMIFSGPESTNKALINDIFQGINSRWTGRFGKYCVHMYARYPNEGEKAVEVILDTLGWNNEERYFHPLARDSQYRRTMLQW